MAGRLVVSTLNNDTGVLNVQNGMTGIPKAWVQFTGATTPTINASFNVSSITYNSAGNFTVNFSTALSSSSYATIVNCGNAGPALGSFCFIDDNTTAPTTSAVRVATLQINGASQVSANFTRSSVLVIGA